ncbi:hypothetical protein QF036_000223 [Arthrobacter globiformis]|nr:hypothetical protein [Arthrobacter globiformis]
MPYPNGTTGRFHGPFNAAELSSWGEGTGGEHDAYEL